MSRNTSENDPLHRGGERQGQAAKHPATMRGHIPTQYERKSRDRRRYPEEPEQKEAASREGAQRAVHRDRQGGESCRKTSGDVKPTEPSMYGPVTPYTHEILPWAAQKRDGACRDMEKEGEWTVGQMWLEFRRCGSAAEWDVACGRKYDERRDDKDGQPGVSADCMGGCGAGDWRLRDGGNRGDHRLVFPTNVDEVNIQRD